MQRRSFFKNTTALLAGSLLFPRQAQAALPEAEASDAAAPIDFYGYFKDPVFVRRIELLRKKDWPEERAWFVRISTDELGYVIPANSRIQYLRGIFTGLVAPFFIGKDLRDLEALLEACYRDERNYKYCGMPLWNCIGHVENAALGLLATLANEPVAAMCGPILRREVAVYLTTFDRKSEPAVYVQNAVEKAKKLGVHALKIKIGGRMGPDPSPGRTQAIIPMFRKALGDDFTLYADSNGSYENLKEILDIGQRLHGEGYAIWEEPCPFREYELTQKATRRLKIAIAGGEQDSSMQIWQRMIRERCVDIVQPDLMYAGGFMRALRIARMAEKAGLQVAPHSPRVAINQAPMLHLAAITPNMTPYQEWQPNDFFASYYNPPLLVNEGKMGIPLGAGWGTALDPDFIKTLELAEGC